MSFFERDDYASEGDDDVPEAFGKDREYIVFIVDASPSMFEVMPTVEDKEQCHTCFAYAMVTIGELMKNIVTTGLKDEVALIFYNTVKHDNPSNHPNVYLYAKRAQPTADAITMIKKFTAEQFQEDIGTLHVDAADQRAVADSCTALKNALWTATDVLQARASRHAGHRLVVFSNEEDPIALVSSEDAKKQFRQMVIDRCEPLSDLGATLSVVPLIAALQPTWDINVFWSAVVDKLKKPEDDVDETTRILTQLSVPAESQDGIARGDELRSRLARLGQYIKSCMQKKRTAGKARWSITDGLEIGCTVYNIFVEAKRHAAFKVRSSDSAKVRPETAKVSEDTAALIPRIEHKSYYHEKLGDRFPKVVFTVEEVASIKYTYPPGLKLLGFKPLSCLEQYYNLDHSSFLRPNDRDVKGSSAVFKSLRIAMQEKKQFALCRYVRTKRSEPCLVALLPQEEVLDEDQAQEWPEGFFLIKLPFKDDIRVPELDPGQVGTDHTVADPDQVAAAAKVVDKMQYEKLYDAPPFKLGEISNPALDLHFRVLEKILKVEAAEPFVDHSVFHTHDNTELFEFQAAVGLDQAAAKPTGAKAKTTGVKRKAGDVDAAPDLSLQEQYDSIPWADLARSGDLKKRTMPDLKIYLKFNNLPVSGTKADLLARIEKHMSEGA